MRRWPPSAGAKDWRSPFRRRSSACWRASWRCSRISRRADWAPRSRRRRPLPSPPFRDKALFPLKEGRRRVRPLANRPRDPPGAGLLAQRRTREPARRHFAACVWQNIHRRGRGEAPRCGTVPGAARAVAGRAWRAPGSFAVLLARRARQSGRIFQKRDFGCRGFVCRFCCYIAMKCMRRWVGPRNHSDARAFLTHKHRNGSKRRLPARRLARSEHERETGQ